ncbi:unnamed protein product [Diamesa hyperborea]
MTTGETLTSRVTQIKSRLISEHIIKVNNDWITGCIEFFIQQNPRISNTDLFSSAMDQYLLGDLTEIAIPTLPDSIALKKEPFILNGKFTLQMMQLIDISESPYDQWRKLHNKVLDDVDETRGPKNFQPKKKRMLKLTLTDGIKTIIAMEYKIIPALNTKFPPGIKLQLIGPINCVNHVLMLESKNIKNLGGEVDTLLIENAYENILLALLNKPMNPNPISDYLEDTLALETERTNSNIVPAPMNTTSSRNQPPKRNPQREEMKIEKELLEGINFDDEDTEMADMELLMALDNEERQHNQPNSQRSDPILAELDNDEDIFAQIDMDDPYMEDVESRYNHSADMEMERDTVTPDLVFPVVNSSNSTSRAFSLLQQPQQSSAISAPPQHVSRVPATSISRVPEPPKAATSSKITEPSIDLTVFPSTSRETHNVVPPIRKLPLVSDSNYPFKIRSFNLVTIQQYVSMKTVFKQNREYVVLCEIGTFLEKLKVRNHEWHLSVTLIDSYSEDSLSVKVTSAVIAKLSGCSAVEFELLRDQSATRPQIREDMENILKVFKSRLDALKCYMKITMNIENLVTLTELIDEPTEVEKKIWNRKLQAENISILC